MSRVGKAVVTPQGKRAVPTTGSPKAFVYKDDEDCCECLTCEDVIFPCEITLVHIDETAAKMISLIFIQESGYWRA